MILLFVTYLHSAIAGESNIEIIRNRYALAVESSGQTELLLNYLYKSKNKDALTIAYKAAAEALMAKHSWSPYNKFSYLRKSKQTFQQAIRIEPASAEIRFLRFSVQHYTPGFLGMSNELDEDKKIIIANIHTTKGVVRNAIIKFLIESGRCNPAEVKLLKMMV